MFYENTLMNSDTLGVVWCYANRLKSVTDNIEIPKICSTIEKWVDHDDSRRRRMSLRTSTLLLNGTARLYKEELDTLYRDCIQLDTRMLYRRAPNTSDGDQNSDSAAGEEISKNSNRRNSREMNRRGQSERDSERSRSRWNTSRTFDGNGMDSMNSLQSQNAKASNKIHTEVQTIRSCIANKKERDRYRRKASDVTIPTGVVIVYNDFRPSKVICANVNEHVKLL